MGNETSRLHQAASTDNVAKAQFTIRNDNADVNGQDKVGAGNKELSRSQAHKLVDAGRLDPAACLRLWRIGSSCQGTAERRSEGGHP